MTGKCASNCSGDAAARLLASELLAALKKIDDLELKILECHATNAKADTSFGRFMDAALTPPQTVKVPTHRNRDADGAA